MKKVGRRIREDRSKAYRNITKLKVKLYDQTRLTELYKKRYQRLLNKHILVPVKMNTQEKKKFVKNLVISKIKERYFVTKSNKEKRFIASLICSHKILKNYRCVTAARNVLTLARRQIQSTSIRSNNRSPKPGYIHI